ncbi:MarR family winged helix-turn-helix transcriptional regulator [Celeribacter indicus]|uniref:MarR family transcriptional regulator n=1 Tax=Celeribacter indicus TaxID=1208324 RepID=A0A0B5DUP2_9RHOB|nr:MarR family transcriptional regulator [Celeribacter indicus]AJE47133.1 MarR family transcriptional regulator [Celeribacter indicus]SDW90023.1 transcriptional regulator, MarR family [Celeribacter indicus]
MSKDETQGEPPRLGRLIGQASRRWRRAVDLRLQGVRVTEAGLAPLVQLARAGEPVRQKDLAAALSLDSSSLVRVIARLEADGLVLSTPDPRDGRAKALSLSPAGAALAARALAISGSLEAEVLSGLDEERIRIAREVLQHVLDRLDADRPDHESPG